jgi:hypothetical protein
VTGFSEPEVSINWNMAVSKNEGGAGQRQAPGGGHGAVAGWGEGPASGAAARRRLPVR